MKIIDTVWTDENCKRLTEWWSVDGLSSGQIEFGFRQLGYAITRNAIIGKVHRMKLKQPDAKKDAEREAMSSRMKEARAIQPNRAVRSKTYIFGNHNRRNPVEGRVIMDKADTTKPDGSKNILMKHSRDGQCKAIVGYENDLLENAIYCGEGTPPKIDLNTGKTIKLPWCPYHHSIYTTEAKR